MPAPGIHRANTRPHRDLRRVRQSRRRNATARIAIELAFLCIRSVALAMLSRRTETRQLARSRHGTYYTGRHAGVSAKRYADRVSPNVAGELAEHDAAVDEIYRQLIAKASKTSPTKSKKTERAQET